jgi:hypothetical protein
MMNQPEHNTDIGAATPAGACAAAAADPQAGLRRMIYALLIAVGMGIMLARILAVDAVDRTARSSDAAIAATIQHERAVLKRAGLPAPRIEQLASRDKQRLEVAPSLRRPFLSANDRSRWATVRALVEPDMRVPGAPYAIDRVVEQPNWDTIDMVQHDGHLYSSKPPLLPTLVAGEYWLIRKATGLSLGTNPYEVARFMLVTINVVPLLVYFCLLAALAERLGKTDWGRIFVLAAAVFGTCVTTFAVVLNNHVLGAVCAAAALYAVVRVWLDGRRHWRYFALAGLLAGLLVADELPGAALAAALGLALLWKAPGRTLLAGGPAFLLVAAGFFGTNWIAHHSLRPPYMHRHTANAADDWYKFTFHGKPSYWQNPQGIDRGEPSRAVYAFHSLIGHHGIFSLTPVWLLSVAGGLMWLLRRGTEPPLRQLTLLVAVVSLVCVGFYLARPLGDRNYGGMTCCFRWVLWLAPLWLVLMLPAADALAGRRSTRGLGLLALALSALSAAYPLWNPWTSPWLMDYWQYLRI